MTRDGPPENGTCQGNRYSGRTWYHTPVSGRVCVVAARIRRAILKKTCTLAALL